MRSYVKKIKVLGLKRILSARPLSFLLRASPIVLSLVQVHIVSRCSLSASVCAIATVGAEGTTKGSAATFRGSAAILDQADHVPSLTVKPEADEDDPDRVYRLGTSEKTRYEPFQMYLSFDLDKGFVRSPDPDEEHLKAMQGLIKALQEENERRLN